MNTTTDTRPLVERITQGEARPIIGRRIAELPDHRWLATFDDGYGIPHAEQTANLELFVDAMNTAHRTRRTPSELASERRELLDMLATLLDRAETVAKGIPVDKRHAGVSPATHVAHMASHLAQHCKPARELIDRLTEAPARRLTEEEIHSQAMTAAFGDHMQG